MSKSILFISCLIMSGCGSVLDGAWKNCGGDLKELCLNITGRQGMQVADQGERLSTVEAEMSRAQAQIVALQGSFFGLEVQAQSVQAQINAQNAVVAGLQAQITAQTGNLQALQLQLSTAQAQLSALETQNAALQAQQTQAQSQINTLLVYMVNLQSQNTIIGLVDPCGDGPGFDEVLLRTSSGQLVAYFESGGLRHLTVLSPGSYSTTDAQHCQFSVDAQNNIH